MIAVIPRPLVGIRPQPSTFATPIGQLTPKPTNVLKCDP